MRFFAALLCAGVLAACQQTSPADERAAEADAIADALASSGVREEDEYTPTAPFRAKHDELALKLSERLLARCLRAYGKPPEVDACVHERFLAGFDTSGLAKTHCPRREDIEAEVKCIMVGAIGYQLAQKVGADEVAAFDWNQPEQSTNQALMQLVLQQVRDCLNTGSASDPQSCLVQRITTALDLTEEDVDPCDVLSDDDREFGRCIGDAFTHKYVSAALTRM
jgi:hypothetical protein